MSTESGIHDNAALVSMLSTSGFKARSVSQVLGCRSHFAAKVARFSCARHMIEMTESSRNFKYFRPPVGSGNSLSDLLHDSDFDFSNTFIH